DRGADGDAAPDAGGEDAEGLRAPLGWGDVDNPSDGAGDEEALAEAVEDAGGGDAPDAEDREVEDAGGGAEGHAGQEGDAAAAMVGDLTGEEPAEKGECGGESDEEAGDERGGMDALVEIHGEHRNHGSEAQHSHEGGADYAPDLRPHLLRVALVWRASFSTRRRGE